MKVKGKALAGYLKYELKNFEKLPVKIWNDSVEASSHVAQSIALAIRQHQQYSENIVLGLATGSTLPAIWPIRTAHTAYLWGLFLKPGRLLCGGNRCRKCGEGCGSAAIIV